MRFALVNGRKAAPQPRLRGICQYCQEEMIAKCGKFVRWHWAHKSRQSCDPWWEAETDWHRNWKNEFPEEWQEVVHTDERTGERHIADVKTPHGFVVEFQHSALSGEERRSREDFYQDMIWIVDGDRGTTDPQFFRMGLSSKPLKLSPLMYGLEYWGSSRLLERWQEDQAHVFFDFGDSAVWRMHQYNPEERWGVVYLIPKSSLVEACLEGRRIRPLAVPEEEAERFHRKMVQIDQIGG